MGAVVVVLAGLVLSSFLGSLSFRIPRHISIVNPPSFCAFCGTRIRAYDLIPVLSYLILKGKCRKCGLAIPVQYFFIELATPLVYLVLYTAFGLGIRFFLYSYLVSLLIYLSLLDIDTRSVGISGCLLVYIGGFLVIYLSLKGKLPYSFTHYLYGSLASLALVSASFLFTFVIKKKVPMGAGDLALIPGMALYFGVQEALRVLIFSSLTGFFVGIVLIMSSRVNRDYKFPMIPFLLSGLIIEIIFFH